MEAKFQGSIGKKDLERIKIYCQKDTLTVAQLLLRYMGKELILSEHIEVA